MQRKLNVFFANSGIGIHFNDIDIFFSGEFENNSSTLFNKILNVSEQSINEAVFVNIVTFFTEHIQNFTGGYHTVFYTIDHIGMLCKMTDGFSTDFAGTFNGNDFFFLNDKFTGIPQNGIQRNDTFFNGIYPFNIDDFFQPTAKQGILVMPALKLRKQSGKGRILVKQRRSGYLIFFIKIAKFFVQNDIPFKWWKQPHRCFYKCKSLI